jgi:hypothetical protein
MSEHAWHADNRKNIFQRFLLKAHPVPDIPNNPTYSCNFNSMKLLPIGKPFVTQPWQHYNGRINDLKIASGAH